MTKPLERLPFTRPSIDEDTIAGVAEVLRSGWLASGPKVQEFEAALSAYLGGRPVRVMTSATAVLEIALVICNVGPGDEVITTPMSWCSTSNVILRLGARPVFVDVDLDSRNLILEQVESHIGPRTRAILPVHFSGLPVDMDRLYGLANRHSLRVIEDAAHAIGSAWGGRRIGSFGDLVSFSFHPNKNMKPAPDELDVPVPGIKANLTDIAARIGIGQLARLEEFNARRRELVAHYYDRWSDSCPLRLPARGDAGHCWHMFAPLLPLERVGMTRKEFIRRMDERGISIGVHYPAIHLMTAYRKLGWHEGQFPNAERVGRETITLPLFPAMRIADVDRVVDTVNDVLEAAG
jgi:dTDP-4-amino-4,6-dideoxygalactose transaminase